MNSFQFCVNETTTIARNNRIERYCVGFEIFLVIFGQYFAHNIPNTIGTPNRSRICSSIGKNGITKVGILLFIELDKRYLAIVEGTPKPAKGSLKGYLFKDAKKNRVFVTDTPQTGAKTCQTNYTVLGSNQGLSLVECELITGRTHQIRAQFAHAGHPLLGDGKYGKLDKRFDRTYQALYSYKLTFQFTTDAGCLAYLNGKSFRVEQVEFAQEYFPNVKI